jgi:hypothetical protein
MEVLLTRKTVATEWITITTTGFLGTITDDVTFLGHRSGRRGVSGSTVTYMMVTTTTPHIIITNPYIISLLKQEKGGKKFAVIFRPQGFS